MEKKNYKESVNKIKSVIYNKKEKSIEKWNSLEKELLFLINNNKDNSKAYMLLAKLRYERKDYENSINSYLYILNNYPECRKQALYGLMKSYIMFGKLDKACDSYYDLEDELVNDETSHDFGIIKVLFAYLYDYSANALVSSDLYMYSKIDDEGLLNLYSNLLDNVIELNFDEAYKQSNEILNYIKNNELEIDFLPCTELLKVCKEKKKQEDNVNIEDKVEDYIWKKDYRGLYELVINNYQYFPKDYNKYKLIMPLVEEGYIEEAQSIYEKACKPHISIDKYLKNAHKENNCYEALDEEGKNSFKDALYKIITCINNENYELAYDIAHAYHYTTRSPLFIFYMGKVLYKLERYKEAICFFKEYIEKASIKLRDAYILLVQCYKMLNIPLYVIPKNNRTYYNDLVKCMELQKYVKFNTAKKVVKDESCYEIMANPLYIKLQNMYLDGFIKQADKQVNALAKQEIAKEEKEVIKLIRSNRDMLIKKSKFGK